MSASCSARILQPFMRYVHGRRLDPDLVPREFWSADADGRVSLEAAQSMLDCAVERLRDRPLGLKLGRSMRFGEGGPFDYAVRSAPTVRDAVDVAARYSKLLSDSLVVSCEGWRRHSLVHLNDVSWTRPAAEFAMAAFYKIHLSDEVPAASQLECWFPYSTPHDTGEHQRSFAGATLRFNAPFFGFASTALTRRPDAGRRLGAARGALRARRVAARGPLGGPRREDPGPASDRAGESSTPEAPRCHTSLARCA